MLIRSLLDEARTLSRQEFQLARAEMMEKAATAARNSTSIAVGFGLALAGGVALLAALSAGLWVILLKAGVDGAIAVWLAPLIVGAVFALLGYALIHKGISTLRHMSVIPHKTTASIKETGQWIQDKIA
jgi:hypothetical protein